jgi:hypothetical protein
MIPNIVAWRLDRRVFRNVHVLLRGIHPVLMLGLEKF